MKRAAGHPSRDRSALAVVAADALGFTLTARRQKGGSQSRGDILSLPPQPERVLEYLNRRIGLVPAHQVVANRHQDVRPGDIYALTELLNHLGSRTIPIRCPFHGILPSGQETATN